MNEYTVEFLRLRKRNRLLESENQPKALQVEGRNFLTIVHDPSSLMRNSKETQEVHVTDTLPSDRKSVGNSIVTSQPSSLDWQVTMKLSR